MSTARVLLSGMLVFGIAASVGAQAPVVVERNDPSRPGSVLVFERFHKGFVTDSDGVRHPKSEFSISVSCPDGVFCFEGQRVKLMAHWVCPGSQDLFDKYVCKETSFVMMTTVAGTITFNPENDPAVQGFFNSTAPPLGAIRKPPAGCQKGYLIVWVVDLFDRAMKFDGLVGHAVIRNGNGSGLSADAHNAYPIQAVSTLVTPTPAPVPGQPAVILTDVVNPGSLDFDGINEYKAVTGDIIGTVRYDRDPTATTSAIDTTVTLLTLDVYSNRPNYPTFVPLIFYNAVEIPTDDEFHFICWGEFDLSRFNDNLTEANQAFGGIPLRNGMIQSNGPAQQVDIFNPGQGYRDVTVIGFVTTREKNLAGRVDRAYSYSLYNNGDPVKTRFEYGKPSPQPLD